jgi:hypothetical protein
MTILDWAIGFLPENGTQLHKPDLTPAGRNAKQPVISISPQKGAKFTNIKFQE